MLSLIKSGSFLEIYFQVLEAYSEPSRVSEIKIFAKLLTVFRNGF